MVRTRAPGSFVLYGVPGDAKHIGLVTRVDPIVLTREGNRGLAGSNTNNGIICDQAAMTRHDILGYVPPEKLLPRGVTAVHARKASELLLADE
jgi:hypothetical protein